MNQHPILLLSLVVLLGGCGMGQVPDYQKDWEALVKSGVPSDQDFQALVKKHPGHWELWLSMGIVSLTTGQRDPSPYLDEALSQKPLWPDKDKAYLLYSGLSQTSYSKGKWKDAVRDADLALQQSPDDPLANTLIKARSLFILGQKSDSKPLFETVWTKSPEKFTRESFQAYFSLLAEASLWDESLAVLDRELVSAGYESGMGLKYSQVLEKLGRYGESLLAAYFDLRYQRFKGAVTSKVITDNLAQVEKQLTSQGLQVALWRPTLDAIRKLELAGAAEAPPLAEGNFPFQVFFQLRERVLKSSGADQPLDDLARWEPAFVGVAEYYELYWTALKKRGSGYTLERIRPFLEKAILLGAPFPAGEKSREELGVLMDLSASEGRRLLMPTELKGLAVALGATGNIRILAPAADMLELGNNPYTDIAVAFLRTLAANDGATRRYLQERWEKAPATSASKYRSVLGG